MIVEWLICEPDICVVGIATDGQVVIDQVLRLQPYVVLMDIDMPIMDGLTATYFIGIRFPTVKVIVIAAYLYSKKDTDAYINLGVAGFIMKDEIEPDILIHSIREAQRHEE